MGAERARPWWASDDPGVDQLAGDEDPLTAHRTARRPAPEQGRAAGHTQGDPGTDREPGPDPDAPAAGSTHDPDTCGLCPVCVGLRLLGEHRPDVLHHLNEASRHLSAAIRGLLEPGLEPGSDSTSTERTSRTSPDRFQRIEVDGPVGAESAGPEDAERGPGTGSA